MVSDSELAEKVLEFLSGSDLKKTTNNIVIHKLESDFGVDLSHRKPFVRHQVDRFLQTQYNFSEEQDEHEDEHGVAFDRNDDVSDSDDEYYEDEDEVDFSVRGVDADSGTTSFNGITKCKR